MKIIISDPTLRDGNHAAKHGITLDQIKWYAAAADKAGIDIIEVGHGNGLGASSLQLGFSSLSDLKMIRAARESIFKAKLGVHVIPGFAKLSDIKIAIEEGVDVFRIASHCTEADTTERYIDYLNQYGKTAIGVLMMSHMGTPDMLLSQASKMESYGASGIILMDSAGAYTPLNVHEKVKKLADNLKVPIGFHAHNNLGLSIANSIAAIESGATIIDATIKGFGAGSGNTALEVLLAAMEKYGYEANAKLENVLEIAEYAESKIIKQYSPTVSTSSIISGIYGVFSGFEKPVLNASQKYGVKIKDIYSELGKRGVVAGQEDMIIDVCLSIKNRKTEEKANGYA